MGFAKLFELPEGDQLLITKETDRQKSDESAQLCFRFRTEKEGVTTTMFLGYRTVDTRDRIFETLTLAMALELYNAMPQNYIV